MAEGNPQPGSIYFGPLPNDRALFDVRDHSRQRDHFLDGDGPLSRGKLGASKLISPLLFSFVFAFLFFLSFEKRRI